MKTLQQLLASDWGQVGIGKRSYPARLLVVVAGATLWLGSMLVETGTGGIVAIWTNLLFLVPLVAIGSATRTVTLRQLLSVVFLGGFMMSVALFVINTIAPATAARAFIVPIIEESSKITPVLLLLWLWRKSRIWSLAATDVLLMAAASGAGFGLVEDAYIRHRFGWPAQLDWLPVTELTGGRIIAGHAIWTALAGVTIGLAILLRSPRRIALVVGVSGFVLSLLDHIANNYGVRTGDSLATFMNGIGAHGYLVLYLFLTGVLVVVAADLYVVHLMRPRLPARHSPAGSQDLRGKWFVPVRERALAHVAFQNRHSSRMGQAKATGAAVSPRV
jgi:RsiW-degrading membrane proteinase PrsW (M82 family)